MNSLGAARAASDEEQRAAIQREADACRQTPGQTISFEIRQVQIKALSEPATPEQEARVKDILAKANLPYDRVKHRRRTRQHLE